MRVLMVNTVRTRHNGITNVIFNLYRAMDKSDMTIDLLAIEKPETIYSDEIERGGGRVIVVSRSIKHSVRYVSHLKKVIKDGCYDIIHVHGNSSSMLLEMIAAKSEKVPIRITHTHSTNTNSPFFHKILRPFLRKMSTTRLSCSRESGLWTYGTHDFRVVANTIDVQKFAFNPTIRQQLRRQYGIEDKTVVYGHVGVFISDKNHDFLIDIFQMIQKKNSDTKLFLIGDGQLKKSIERKVEFCGISNKVVLMGSIDNVYEYLNMFDVFLFPSLHEGFGIAPLEAQANGLPVIAAKDNVPEAVKATCSLEFLPLSLGAAKWAEKIMMMNTARNPNAAQEIISAGYDTNVSTEVLKKIYIGE